MQLNYTKLNISLGVPCCLSLFLALFIKLKIKALIYLSKFLVYFQCALNFMPTKKSIVTPSINLISKSIFRKGLVRDLVSLNLFFYKLKFVWFNIFIGSIKQKTKVKITLLRSPFVNKKARLQYALKTYTCFYSLSIKNIWFLHYLLNVISQFFFFKYSTLNCFYSYFLQPK